MAELYGKLFSIRLGSDKIVFASGYKMVKEAIVTQADNFVDRPFNAFSDRIYMGQKGLQTSQHSNLRFQMSKSVELKLATCPFCRWSVPKQR